MFRKIIEILTFKKSFNGIVKHKNVSLDVDAKASVKIDNAVLKLGTVWNKKDPFKSLIVLNNGANLYVKENFKIYSGSKIYINKDATLTLGSGYINHNLNLSCFNKITIGRKVAISENVTIRDSDNHIVDIESEKSISAPIVIEDNVWIGMNVTILKGVTIGEGAIVAAGSLVNKDVKPNTLVGGVPAVVIKNDVKWQ
ncbi:putative acetyltransferase [unidentified eubacterium SCB49]|nr:putative acetyltransferase [unidentified eubacterium SCB49]